MAAHHYRPAALRAPVEVLIGGAGMRVGDGPLRPWSALTGLRFSEVAGAGGLKMIWLDLSFGTATERLSVTGEPGALAPFAVLLQDLAGHLARARPDMTVQIGADTRTRWAFFGLGLASLLAGGGIAVAMLAGGMGGARMTAAALPVLMLLGLGGVLVAGNRPGRAAPHLPLAALRKRIAALAGGGGTA